MAGNWEAPAYQGGGNLGAHACNACGACGACALCGIGFLLIFWARESAITFTIHLAPSSSPK